MQGESQRMISFEQLQRPVRSVMRPVETSIRDDATIGQALQTLHRCKIDHKIFYIYVVDADNRLRGVLPTRGLIVGEPDRLLRDVMIADPITLHEDDTIERAIHLFLDQRLLAFPVVDDDGRLLGLVDVRFYTREVSELVAHEHETDLFQVMGLHVEQLRTAGALRVLRFRLPWLMCNLAGGIACAAIGAAFGAVLEHVVIIAMFIPLVLTLAESISMQALTLTLHLTHSGRLTRRQIVGRFRQELPAALLLGVVCAGLVALAALAWSGDWRPPAAIGASVAASMVMSALWGTLIPAALLSVRRDPKLASGPMVLMLTDVTTLTLYLSLAWVLLL